MHRLRLSGIVKNTASAASIPFTREPVNSPKIIGTDIPPLLVNPEQCQACPFPIESASGLTHESTYLTLFHALIMTLTCISIAIY